MTVAWSPDAAADIEELSRYIEEATSLATANRITRTIYEVAQSLKKLPNRGRPGRIKGIRELVVSNLPYIIMYRVFPEHVVIFNIVPGKQQWP
jgi:toxin ParE1/3/4